MSQNVKIHAHQDEIDEINDNITSLNSKFTNAYQPSKNSSYVGTTYVHAIRIGNLVNVSGRFEIVTQKPAGQENYFFSGLPVPLGEIVAIADNSDSTMFVAGNGTITSNNVINTGWRNISVTYACK